MNRNTKQRESVFRVMREAGRPLAIKEILRRGRRCVPTLGLRTVYRHIREMAESGRLVELDYPGQPPRYEAAVGARHPHFICARCKRLFDFMEDTPELPYKAPPGFKIEGSEVTFYGTCPECGEGG